MKTLSLTLLGLAIATALWYQLAQDVSLNPSALSDKGRLVTSYLGTGVRTQFTSDGKPADVLAIGKAERREGSDETALSDIRFYSETADGAQWHIKSSAGLFFEEANELLLLDGVRVLEATRKGTLETESMWLFIDKKRATGNRDVVLTSPGSRTSGTGFELDLARDTATLKGRVKTEYE